jgi:hypothetical protein
MLHGASHKEATSPRWIKKLTLQTNENGQNTHNAILLLQKAVWRILQSQFNPSNPGKGMEKLLDTGYNRLTLVKSTDAITAGSVIKKAKQNAKVLSILTGKTVLPIITTRAEAQEEANQLKVINQSVIGAMEGAVEAIMKQLAATLLMPSYAQPMAATTRASTTSRYSMECRWPSMGPTVH